VGYIEVYQPNSVVVNSTASTMVIGADPLRVWLVIAVQGASNSWWAWPFQFSGSVGISPPTGQNHLLIHSASFPGAVQNSWYVRSAAATPTAFMVAGRTTERARSYNVC
jgi:hypothetical protein